MATVKQIVGGYNIEMSTSSNIHTNQTSRLARQIAALRQMPIRDLDAALIKLLVYINNLKVVYDESNTHKVIAISGHKTVDHWMLISTTINGKRVDELFDINSSNIKAFFKEYGLSGDSLILYDKNDRNLASLILELQFDGYNLLDIGSDFINVIHEGGAIL